MLTIDLVRMIKGPTRDQIRYRTSINHFQEITGNNRAHHLVIIDIRPRRRVSVVPAQHQSTVASIILLEEQVLRRIRATQVDRETRQVRLAEVRILVEHDCATLSIKSAACRRIHSVVKKTAVAATTTNAFARPDGPEETAGLKNFGEFGLSTF